MRLSLRSKEKFFLIWDTWAYIQNIHFKYCSRPLWNIHHPVYFSPYFKDNSRPNSVQKFSKYGNYKIVCSNLSWDKCDNHIEISHCFSIYYFRTWFNFWNTIIITDVMFLKRLFGLINCLLLNSLVQIKIDFYWTVWWCIIIMRHFKQPYFSIIFKINLINFQHYHLQIFDLIY